MDLSEYSGTNFRKATDPDLKAGPKRVKITKIEIGKFEKPDIYFDDNSILSANKTNMRELIRAFGSDSSNLIGREVELFVGEVAFQGSFKTSVLVRPISDSELAPAPAPTSSSTATPIPLKRRKRGGGGGGDMDDSIPFLPERR
jgi:hypothetical protein